MVTNTGIGVGIGIPFRNNARGGDKPYLPPEIKDSLKAIVIAYGKTNNDSDRAIVKNLVDPDNPFVISNAAFKLNSGFGKYEVDFTVHDNQNVLVSPNKLVSIAGKEIISSISYTKLSKDVPSYKVKVTGLNGEISYWYRNQDGSESRITITEDGIYQLPVSYNVEEGAGINNGFNGYSESSCTIEQIPSFEGAFVTDGIDDLITSTKAVQEMLGGSNECTVLSMIHQITDSTDGINRNNWLFASNSYLESRVEIGKKGKTGIYGYTSADISNGQISNINTILGDKGDYTVHSKIESTGLDYFSVEGFQKEGIWYTSSLAWYWTIIANKVLTTDQINQVIAYFNLDRTLKPDILCDVKKQGITNDNHAEFGDKLIDFSGNGRDIQLNNIAWKGDSGIGKYETEFSNTSIWTKSKETTSSPFSSRYNGLSGWTLFANTSLANSADMPSFKIQVKGLLEGQELIYRYYDSNGQSNVYSITKDGDYTLPSDFRTAKPQISNTSGFQVVKNEANIITITQIPSHAGALCLDGVNDFGKVTGMPIYKDYTFIIEREFLNETFPNQVCLVSKSKVASEIENGGAFIVDNISANSIINPYSFYKTTSLPGLNTFDRQIVFQSKYKYLDKDIAAGTATDSDTLWLGTFRDNDSRFANVAIYFLMSFPYSMSEFLIERQLKKHKLGTLYPDMVEFRPIVKSNSEYQVVGCYIDTLPAVVGNYYPINSKLRIAVTTKGAADEVTSLTVNGVSLGTPSVKGNRFTFNGTLSDKSPQKINITIDEYIRYEDIVQPYPVLLRFNDENGNEVSWGGKFRVGSTITRIGSIDDTESNLLNGLYSISGLSLNGKAVTSSTSIVEKQMVFKTTATYLLDNNEPNCILSPRLLRIPNSSYKILGHIPDISGHGNHGKINNSAYAGMSGANGYPNNFNNYTVVSGVTKTDNIIKVEKELSGSGWFLSIPANTSVASMKLNIDGIPSNKTVEWATNVEGIGDITLINGVNEIPAYTSSTISGIYAIYSDLTGVSIEQIGEYEGAYCLDGIDDFITIPTLSKGGKQVLMKVNWSTLNGFIYDQRPASGDKTFGIYAQGDVIAYSQNNNGNTYIDGIINNNIIGSNLSKITHNIVATCDVDNSITPSIGKLSYSNSYFAQMSLYDFMLFDEISTDDKIKELNTYIGITPKVTLPNYYWDNYGKKNIDANRGYIDEQVSLQKTGTSVNPLENFNIGYEGMSGYNGYPVVFGANKTWERLSGVHVYTSDVTNTTIHVTHVEHATSGLLYSYVKRDGALANIKEIPAFRVTVKGLEENSKLIYKYLATENATKESIVYLGNGTHKLPKSFVPTDALLDLTTSSWIGFTITPMIEGELVFDCDITIEILPEYENGLVYDGVSDFTDNKNIPIFTDFTAIIKRVDLDAKNDNSTVMFKGNKIYESSIGNGFILDYCYNSKNYVYSYGKLNQIERDDSKIIYLTPKSYNGNPIIKGENRDNLGLVLGKYWKGIIYKTILYSKTISLLEINFLKNLIEKDEIIDINHPIFISNTEDKSNTSQDT